MKPLLVAVLLRLYPARWRAEYGEEFAGILIRRPLGAAGVLNVLANAVRQQWRSQEPWLLIAAPILVWMAAYLALSFFAPDHSKQLGGKPTILGIAIFVGVGFWTVLRKGHGGGRAAMKLSIAATLPILLLGFLVMLGLLPTGSVRAITGTGREDLLILTLGPILQIPYAGLLGWVGGGLAARLFRR